MLRPRIHAPAFPNPRAAKSSVDAFRTPPAPVMFRNACLEKPAVQCATADAERIVDVLAGTGAIAVEGNRKSN